MTEEPKRLTRQEIRRLKPGDWVAWKRDWPISWPKDNWTTPTWEEGRLEYPAARSAQHVQVRINGLLRHVSKNCLHRVQPIITIETQHEQYDYIE
jgi:broad specificity phosphatase PhoE